MKQPESKPSRWFGSVKLAVKRQPYMVLAIILSMLLVSGSGYIVASSHPLPKPVVKKKVAVIKPQPHVTPTYLETLPDPNAKPAAAPAVTTRVAPKSQGSGTGITACNQQLANAYNKYSATIISELSIHNSKLAQLKSDYDNGAYDDPDTGETDEAAYQDDVTSENNRYFSLIDGYYQTYKAEVAANGCPPIS